MVFSVGSFFFKARESPFCPEMLVLICNPSLKCNNLLLLPVNSGPELSPAAGGPAPNEGNVRGIFFHSSRVLSDVDISQKRFV